MICSLERDGNRVISHFDYDTCYASVSEKRGTVSKSASFIIQRQQKQYQIVFTCNHGGTAREGREGGTPGLNR